MKTHQIEELTAFGLIGLIIVVMFALYLVWKRKHGSYKCCSGKFKSLLLPASALLLLSSCNTRIDAGKEGILVKQYGTDKGVQDVSLVTGRVWYNPFTEEVHEFPVFVQTVDYPAFSLNASDGSMFTVDPTISFRIEQGRTPEIFKKYRKPLDSIATSTLLAYVKDAFRIEFNNYTTDSIISKRKQFENAIQINLQNLLTKEGFILEQMTSGIQYPQSIVDAINAKNTAVQRAAQANNQMKVAEANARIKIVEAEAEAKVNELRQRTLTPLLIQQQFIEKWDGKTPLYGSSPVNFKNVN